MAKTAFLFSGQGAQYPGMMKDIYESYPEAQYVFKQADTYLNINLSEIIFNGPEETLNQTKYTQPSLLTCEAAIFTVLKALKCNYDFLEGFSLGEWTALLAANVISFENALSIIQKRAQYMQEAVPIGDGGMAVVLNQTVETVNELCLQAGEVVPANYNCQGQITVSGKEPAIQALLDTAEERGIIAKRLAVSIPSHCMLMQPAAEQLQKYIENYNFSDAEVPIIMNYNAQPETEGAMFKNKVISQLTNPVYFEASVNYLLSQGTDTFVEIGPGKTLAGLVKRIAKNSGKKVSILKTGTVEFLKETVKELTGGYE